MESLSNTAEGQPRAGSVNLISENRWRHGRACGDRITIDLSYTKAFGKLITGSVTYRGYGYATCSTAGIDRI